MPRSASKSIFKSKTAPSPSPSSSVVVHKTETPGFFSNVMQGFGLGAGQSLAMNLFRSPTEVKHTYQASPDSLPKEYVQCMKESQNNKEACKQYLE
jgi:hypothetical protein